MRFIIAFITLLSPLPAMADAVIDRVLETVILPGVSRFADATAALETQAKADCRADSDDLRGAWHTAMDAWFGIQNIRFGPLEARAQRQAIAYWPDSSGHRPRALFRILSGQDPILQTPERYADESVTVRGLYALEAMLFDPEYNGYGLEDAGCQLVRAAAADLASVAANVNQQWRQEFAEVMRTAGAPENTRFLDETEARQAVFTALVTSLQFDVVERLGLPLGSFDKPRPLRAEGRISGRSQRNLALSLAGHQRLAAALTPAEAPSITVQEEFERALWMVSKLDDPIFAGVEDPMRRIRIESLQTMFSVLRAEINTRLSAALGVTMGLNALDGD